MKNVAINILIISCITLLVSCADYDQLNASLHPEAVSLTVTNYSDSTVTLRWTQYQGTDFKNYKVYYSQNDVVETTDSIADSLTFAFDTIKTVSHLKPGYTYYFRVIMNNSAGAFSASNIVSATTSSGGNGTIKLFDADTVSDSIFKLHWTRTSATVDKYIVVVDTQSQVVVTDSLIKNAMQDTFSIATTGQFQKNRWYWFRVFARRDTSVVASSNTIQVWFPKKSVPPKPVSVLVTKATDSSVTIKWSQYAGTDFGAYKIYYALDESFSNWDTLYNIDSLQYDTVRTIKPLLPETQYFFRVGVTNTDDKTVNSNVDDTTTLIRKNGKITIFTPTMTTDSSIALHWTKSTVNFDKYKVFADTSLLMGDAANVMVAIVPKDTFAIVSRLGGLQKPIKDHPYWFKVVAVRQDSITVATSNVSDQIIINSK